ncbi:Cytochrome P450 2J5 [Orchesella cincta]|uniref:Cytochrome P450 2J5 n=1 Tax=Orchesella cincta TaxID=48709 RepID=A0A1D2NKM8_ORCCI|nr:Cytochrome P450 2J5 [Orchesella cincta]
MVAAFWIALVCAWIAYMYFTKNNKAVDLPGPGGLPFVGCLFQLDKRFHLILYKYAEKYGKAVYFKIFNEHFVTINDAKMGKELFSMDQLSGRPVFDAFLLYEGEKLGVVNSEGQLWETHRRFTLRQLRDFGFGKNTMEMLIMDEVNDFAERIKNAKGAPVGEIKKLLSLAVVNSLWTIVSGKRYSQDDANLKAISNSLDRALSASADTGGIVFFMPWLRYIMPEYTGYAATRRAFEQLRAFVEDSVKEHQKTFKPDVIRDFIDVYLKEMHSVTDPKSTFYGKEGGTDTTSTTLAWAILYLATHPEVQKKLQAEISSITADSRDVSVADRSSMPYSQATIEEVFRMSSILPNGVQHQVLTDVTFQGTLLPKGTMVSMNAFYIHYDPALWDEPAKFKPERFLVDNGKAFKKSDHVVPFSIGKRHCLGESLARDTIFLFLTNIVKNFNVECDPSNPNPTLEPAIGFTLNPQEYSVIFKVRGKV